MTDFSRADQCIVALSDAFRGDGEILASPMTTIAMAAVRLAKLTHAPDLMMSDGVASLVANVAPIGAPASELVVEGWVPYRTIFDVVWSGRRHVVMGASQIDRFGNQNISAIGDYARPKSMLLGVRGAPGNTVNHTTSYLVPNHSTRSFVPRVDVVSGVGYDRAKQLGRAGRFHEIRRVVSNLGVFDFGGPDHAMRLVSTHAGVSVDDVVKNTGFELSLGDVTETRAPTDEELRLLRGAIDPRGLAQKEIAQ
ncbi:MAG: CoA-transferase [Polyangiaceae bacterium]|nr:CoA-transferase [Polyangiaceae bacterium]